METEIEMSEEDATLLGEILFYRVRALRGSGGHAPEGMGH